MMPPRTTRWLLALLLACVAESGAAIIYSGAKNLAIPADFSGVYLNLTSGATGSSEFSGWDFNAFFGGLGVANSPAFQPVRTGSGSEDPILPISFGDEIGAGLVYSTGYGGSGAEDDSGHLGPGAAQFVDGTPSYIGFALLREEDVFYGWMRVLLTRNGLTGLLQSWAYDDSGVGITAGVSADVGAEPITLKAGETQTATAATAGTALVLEAGAEFTFSQNSTGAIYTGNIMGYGELKIAGSGSLSLSGTNTFSGNTTVTSGTLLVNSSLPSSPVTVQSGGTLGGNGTLGQLATLNSGAILSPGNSVGTLTFANGLTLNATSTVTMEINSSDPGGNYDRVIVSGGGIRYDGTLKLVFTGGYSPANGDNYQLFDITGGHTGTFLNFDTGNVPVEFDAPTGLLTVVPEPSTWALLLLSTLALAALRPQRTAPQKGSVKNS